jgi:GntR family histidine utilization transcriptional repressor
MTVEERIRSDIETRIHSGEWHPGDRIPFEHQLVETYRCSRATVSKAMSSLVRAGLIERRRKAGSFVARPQAHSAVLAVPDLAQIIGSRGEQYRWDLKLRRPANAKEAAPLDSPALLVKGVHFGDDIPFALEERVIALDSVPKAADADFRAESPGSWLLHHVPWTSARHEIRAVAATRGEAAVFDERAGLACLELVRTTWRSERTVTHVRQLFPGARFQLVAEFKPGVHGG